MAFLSSAMIFLVEMLLLIRSKLFAVVIGFTGCCIIESLLSVASIC